jgi:hypothetical protein
MDGGWNGGACPPVAVSSAAPCFNRQAGQSPASVPAGSSVPHCGHFGMSDGVTGVPLIHPTQKQITTDVTGKVLKTSNIEQPTTNIQ